MKALAVIGICLCIAFAAVGAEAPVIWLVGCRGEEARVDPSTPHRVMQVCIDGDGMRCTRAKSIPVVGTISQGSLDQLVSLLGENRVFIKSVAIENQVAYVYFLDGPRNTRAYVPGDSGWRYHSTVCNIVVD